MKKRYIVLISLLVIVMLLLVACNNNGEADGFKYKSAFSMSKFDTDGIIIEKYVGSDTNVVVPNQLDGHPVRELSAYTFTGTNVQTLKFGNRVCNEGVANFKIYEALNLKKLYLPNNDNAYFLTDKDPKISGCSSLQEIHFPPLFYKFESYGSYDSPSIVGCNNLRKLYFYNTHTVLDIYKIGKLFETDLPKTFFNDLTIYVPANLLNEYKLHSVWKNFNLATFDANWVEP